LSDKTNGTQCTGNRGRHHPCRVSSPAGDNFLWLAVTIPEKVRLRQTGVVVVLHSDVVSNPGLKGNNPRAVGNRLIHPMINYELVVYPEAYSIIRPCHKIVFFRVL